MDVTRISIHEIERVDKIDNINDVRQALRKRGCENSNMSGREKPPSSAFR